MIADKGESELIFSCISFFGNYATHKSFCARVTVNSSEKCTCGYDDKKSVVNKLSRLALSADRGDFVLLKDVAFMQSLESDKIYVVDVNKYRLCVSDHQIKNLVKHDVTEAMHVALSSWFKND